jgi:hypothetical protein
MTRAIGPGRPEPDGFRNLAVGRDGDSIAWLESDGSVHTSMLDRRATTLHLENASIARMPIKYPHRPHYEGYYWFAGTGKHTWHESMEEYAALMWLDHRFDIYAIAAQPMCIFFEDGSRHYPDYFAVHSSGHQVLYDVRPEQLIDDRTREQFEKTREVCKHVGWGYEVLTGLQTSAKLNLELIAAYRHPRNRPDAETADRILRTVGERMRLDDLARFVDSELPARHIHHIYNLIWCRRLEFDTRRPMNWSTTIWRS